MFAASLQFLIGKCCRVIKLRNLLIQLSFVCAFNRADLIEEKTGFIKPIDEYSGNMIGLYVFQLCAKIFIAHTT